MKGYTPITTLKDFVHTYSSYKSDTEIAYLLNVTEEDIMMIREEFKKKSDSEDLIVQ
ncbi:hypothetical protein [Paramaledivibacter caminithermalis]|jgi:hypothetical protein|uniref:Uncharacterized protein n=1 Tax=Paramaledivibacter caminithermalis (strain DSM 15212 / CIP 107654 / DViRD3) TaxID=1121301 RepID=A0A1M6QB04_PARC5|nr:hypothetical protein [Paramaledivibacter caminithermalis]SHK17338.1 hypothetical protein SAMN02745912_02503 [Paramaledivibacter caminithermalis DSM 15212]